MPVSSYQDQLSRLYGYLGTATSSQEKSDMKQAALSDDISAETEPPEFPLTVCGFPLGPEVARRFSLCS